MVKVQNTETKKMALLVPQPIFDEQVPLKDQGKANTPLKTPSMSFAVDSLLVSTHGSDSLSGTANEACEEKLAFRIISTHLT